MVYVPDWQEGLRWYGRAFPDAELSTVSNGFAYLNYQGVSIEVVAADDKVSAGVGGTVAYWRTERFDERLAHLVAAGAALFRGPMALADGLRMCQVQDPFGNAIGLREVA